MPDLTPYEAALGRYSHGTQRRLQGWYNRTKNGFHTDLRGPVYHDLPRFRVMDRWWDILQTFDMHPDLYSFEREEALKLGPYSLQEPWDPDRKADAWRFFADDRSTNMSANEWRNSLAYLQALIPDASLVRAKFAELLSRTPKNTNSGLPTFSRDRGYLSQYQERFNEAMAGWGAEVYPFVAGWRGQPGYIYPRPWTKQRLLFMADRLEGWLGGQFVYPIIDTLKGQTFFSAWANQDTITAAVKRVLLNAQSLNVPVYSTDFSGFDASVPEIVLNDVFDVVASWFTATVGLGTVQDSFVHGGLLTPDGLLQGRRGGIPSGSVFTNVIGTFVNLLSAEYIARRLDVMRVDGEYLGDDALNVYGRDPGAERIQDAGGELNLSLNADKQFVSRTTAHFLQNVYILEDDELLYGGGVRPTSRALNGMLSYERARRPGEWNEYLALMRTVMQLENCKYHPAFPRFVEFVAEGDRRLLEIDVTEIARRAGGAKAIEESLGITSFRYTSQDVSGLSGFKTTEVLRQLR